MLFSDEAIELMKNTDVKKAEPAALGDIGALSLDDSLPQEENRRRFLETVGNPYCFRFGNMVLKVAFSPDGPSLDELLGSGPLDL